MPTQTEFTIVADPDVVRPRSPTTSSVIYVNVSRDDDLIMIVPAKRRPDGGGTSTAR